MADSQKKFMQRGPEGRRVNGPQDVTLEREDGRMVYFGNRLCPFAHRAWLAIHEKNLADKIDYVHIELGEAKPAWFQEHFSPAGTVPVLYVGGKPVYESNVIAEFLEEAFPGDMQLMPSDPFERASVRVLLGALDVSPFYKLLLNQDRAKDAELGQAVVQAFGKIDNLYAASSPEGPFFLGERLSLADIAILPFLDRARPSLKHYRGFSFFGDDGARFPRLKKALEAAQDRPAWKATSQPPEFYIAVYANYASGIMKAAASDEP